MVVVTLTSVSLAQTAQAQVTTERWRGEHCESYPRLGWNATVCMYVNIHDFYDYKQGLVRISRNYSGPRMTVYTIVIQRDGLIVAANANQASESDTFMDRSSPWDEHPDGKNHNHTWKAYASMEICYPNGVCTGRFTQTSYAYVG